MCVCEVPFIPSPLREAAEIAQMLQAKGWVPDIVLASNARRTKQVTRGGGPRSNARRTKQVTRRGRLLPPSPFAHLHPRTHRRP